MEMGDGYVHVTCIRARGDGGGDGDCSSGLRWSWEDYAGGGAVLRGSGLEECLLVLCKMGDELTTALEKLAQLLVAKNAESTFAEGGAVSQAEMVKKVELMPNEVKLEGMSNYLSWSRRALLILRIKGLDGHVQGSDAEPEDKGSADWKKWSATDSLIFAWLLNSLTPSIVASAEGLPNAAEVDGV
ncbi:hypothetical protein QYE76_050905 [Lolium multiflorum]|uniref:Retrotransposon Copia-like N-terminal domain-containing protein n=1 Tax=Lolium multiflorum TaxID=4521 RepID=A0AAD8SQX4_LOLMU|nr:hypothetical protein QYE76_050905 [Lolium multiflorum]